jgi:transcription initiation factor TFIIIB Brf1 subunit/transcription initiation factor TFIIB
MSNSYLHKHIKTHSINKNRATSDKEIIEKITANIKKKITMLKNVSKVKNFNNVLAYNCDDDNTEIATLDTNSNDGDEITENDVELINSDKCIGCDATGTLLDDKKNGVIICTNCGMENEIIIDNGPDMMQYNNDDSRGNVNTGYSVPSSSSYYFPRITQGTLLVGMKNSKWNKKQNWDIYAYKEKSLMAIFEIISDICKKNNISQLICDTAKYNYKKIKDSVHTVGNKKGKSVIIRGKNMLNIIAACISKACDANNYPLIIKEIAFACNITDKRVSKGIKIFDKIIKNTEGGSEYINQHNTSTPKDFIKRHSAKLMFGKENIDLAVKIAKNCTELTISSNHNSQSIAATSIILMAEYRQLYYEKDKIIALFCTSEVTINKIKNKMMPYMDILIDDTFTQHVLANA